MDDAKPVELEETNRVYECENQDAIDGFRKFIKRTLSTICKKYDKKATGAASFLDGAKPTKVAGEIDMDLSDVYDFSHPQRGLAVIINNDDFSLTRQNNVRGTSLDDRPGSSFDASALSCTFKKLGFDVFLAKNLEDKKMVKLLKSAKDDYDHANADCFVCAILTHGEETSVSTGNNQPEVRLDLLYGSNGKAVETSSLVDMFSDESCPTLKGKPRLFFIQACRGVEYDDGTLLQLIKQKATTSESERQSPDGTDKTQAETERPHDGEASASGYSPRSQGLQTDTTDAIPDYSENNIEEDLQNINVNAISSGGADMTDIPGAAVDRVRHVRLCPTPLYKDSLIMYATTPGHYAWRRDSGAWFVQTLCKVLDKEDIGSKSLLSALVNVVGIVARDFESRAPSEPSSHQKKETPVIESMLVKDVFFTPK